MEEFDHIECVIKKCTFTLLFQPSSLSCVCPSHLSVSSCYVKYNYLWTFNIENLIGCESLKKRCIKFVTHQIYIHNYFSPHYIHPSVCLSPCPVTLLIFTVISQNVTDISSRYVLKVKNMHAWSGSNSWGPCGKAKLSYVHYDIRQGEAELHILNKDGDAKLCVTVFNIKTQFIVSSYL